MKIRLALLAVLALALAVPATAQAPRKIRLGVHTDLMGAPDVIAVRQGFFKQEGVEVEWRRFALGKEGRDAMIAGAIDVNSTASTPFLIGLDKGTITEFIFAARVAPSHGLKPGEYDAPNIPDNKDRIPSLVARAIDAAVVNDPFVSVAEHEGIVRSIENFCKYDPLPFMLTVTNKIIKENPDAVVAYLRGWLRAVKLLKDEPQKAAAVYADEQKSLGREVSSAVIDKALRRMRWEPDLTPQMEK